MGGVCPPGQVRQFEKYIYEKYGKQVKLDVKTISDPNQFFDGLRSKTADIISPTHNVIKDRRFNLITKGLILPVDLKNIPNYKNLIPALQKAEYITEAGNVYGVPLVHGPYGLAYNTACINAPESWNVFWDPKFSGRYTLSSDYYEVNIYITALALGYRGSQIYTAEGLNTPEFKNKLKALAANAKSLWASVDKADDLQGLTLAAAWGFSLPELRRRGEIWKIAEPKEGTMGWIDNYVINWSLRGKPFLKRVAEEWLNFVISPDFQLEVIVRGLGSAPVNLAVKDRLLPEEFEKFHMDDPNYFEHNRILWPTLERMRDRNMMRWLWNEAMKTRN